MCVKYCLKLTDINGLTVVLAALSKFIFLLYLFVLNNLESCAFDFNMSHCHLVVESFIHWALHGKCTLINYQDGQFGKVHLNLYK